MDYRKLMELVSTLGTNLAIAGAETYRVEESVVRVCRAYGVEAKVYSVPNSLFITLTVPDGMPITQLCRIDKHTNDLNSVEVYSNISRRICSQIPSLDSAIMLLNAATASRKFYSFPVTLLGYILVAGGFCLFFGGTLRDCLCAGACGLLLGFADYLFTKIQVNVFFQKIIAAFFMALAACGMAALHWNDNVDTVMIGSLMLLVPGILFTNALRDIIFGDTNSGINRIVETLLIAVAIALGTAAAWNFSGSIWILPPLTTAQEYSALVTCFSSLVACFGFVLVFNIHGFGKLFCALGGVLAWAVYCLTQYYGGSPALCSFFATVTAGVYSEIMARIRKYPATSYLVISLLPMIPGAGVYYCAQQAISGNLNTSLSYGLQALTIAGTIAAGILLVSTIVRTVTAGRSRHADLKAAQK